MKSAPLYLSLLGVLFLFITKTTYSQEPQITWGQIPKSDLEMQSYAADTNASALILYDRGESFLDDYLHINFRRHLRIKILTPKGYEWGTHSVRVYTANGEERVEDIEGITYNLEKDGQVSKNKLSSKDIFKEKVTDKVTLVKFTLPALQPGCVIEMKYSIISEHVFSIRGWEFQYSEPALWSEYNMRSPKAIAYSSVSQGSELFTIQDMDDDATQVFSGEAESFLGRKIVPCTQRRWAVQNVPALRDEPFLTTIEDHRTKINLQLTGFSSDGMIKMVLDSWEKVIKDLYEDEKFGDRIEETSKIKKITAEIISGLSSNEDKMKAIYNWVSNSIVCNDGYRLYADKEINDVIESKKGSNAEISFLLLSMLKCAGINGSPVILSTRENGRIQTLYPILSQFNYVLAKVDMDSTSYFLDATDPMRPYDILPYKVLNIMGLVIKQKGIEWVNMPSNKKSYNAAIVNINLNRDGSFTGNIEDLYKDVGALNLRHMQKDKTEKEIAKLSFDADKAGITVDSALAFGKDTISVPYRLFANISSNNYAQSNGDLIYINPQIINRRWDNPFKSQKRKFPIDYAYGRSNVTVINITIPDSFEVKEKLEDRYHTACSNDLVYTRNFSVEGRKIQMRTKFEIRNSILHHQYYAQIRKFYEDVVAAGQEQIVLSRIKEAPVQAAEKIEQPADLPEPPAKKAVEVKLNNKKKKK